MENEKWTEEGLNNFLSDLLNSPALEEIVQMLNEFVENKKKSVSQVTINQIDDGRAI